MLSYCVTMCFSLFKDLLRSIWNAWKTPRFAFRVFPSSQNINIAYYVFYCCSLMIGQVFTVSKTKITDI